jgi:hypothetical protein
MPNYYATTKPHIGYHLMGSFEDFTEAVFSFGCSVPEDTCITWWSDEDCGEGPGWGEKPAWTNQPEWSWLGDSNVGERDISFAPLELWERGDGLVVVYNPCENNSPRKFEALYQCTETYPSLDAAANARGFVRNIRTHFCI